MLAHTTPVRKPMSAKVEKLALEHEAVCAYWDRTGGGPPAPAEVKGSLEGKKFARGFSGVFLS